jgi:hypothetical protein
MLESSYADDHPPLKSVILVEKSVITFMFGIESKEHL